MVSSAYLRLWIFLPVILIPACDPSSVAYHMMVFSIEGKEAGWQYTALLYSFSDFEAVFCFMSGCNCCFLTCIQISWEASKVVWYAHLLKNCPQVSDPWLLGRPHRHLLYSGVCISSGGWVWGCKAGPTLPPSVASHLLWGLCPLPCPLGFYSKWF